jgi:hypothetical protein
MGLIRYNSETAPDWEQRYVGCFGFLHKTGQPRKLIRFLNADNSTAEFSEEDGLTQHVVVNSAISFEFPTLERRWWPTEKGSPILTIRRPRRQWRRGISSDNCYFSSLSGDVPLTFSPGFENLKTIFFPPDVPSDRYLSPAFALSENNTIFFFDIPIGTIDPTKKLILVSKLFMQEVFDVVKRLPRFQDFKVVENA